MDSSNISATPRKTSFRCTYCQREFRRLEHLQRHTRKHTNEKPFSCSCGALFTRKDLLKRHERIVHNGSEEPGQTPSPGNGRMRTRQSCAIGNPADNAADASRVSRRPTSHQPRNSRNRFVELESLIWEQVGLDDQEITPADDLLSNETANVVNPAPINSNIKDRLPTIFATPNMFMGSRIVPYFTCPVIAEHQRDHIIQSLEQFKDAISEFNLPSTDSLTRFLAGYFSGFYWRAPVAHAPTFKVEECSPESLLSMFAIGAAYRYESHSAKQLFYGSKAILMERKRRIEHAQSSEVRDIVGEISCLLCLVSFAAWQKELGFRNESVVLQGFLAHTLRSSSLNEDPVDGNNLDWKTWAQQESARRAKLFAFCFLNIHSIAYDLPPAVLGDEIKLRLPCSCPEWTSPDATTWTMFRHNFSIQPKYFHIELNDLLSSTPQGVCNGNPQSPMANYVLMHGLTQKIMWTQRLFLSTPDRSTSTQYQSVFENALRRWTVSWQGTPESNLEPLDPNGPLPFTSSALLSLAYIRNCYSPAHARGLLSWDPAHISSQLRNLPSLGRDWNKLLAALHSTHVLSTLVRLGIPYVRNNQAFVWSIEDALCGLECAIFLDKWLRSVEKTVDRVPLTEHETLLVHWLQEILQEGIVSLNGEEARVRERSRLGDLADQSITLWSHVMRGTSPWSFINMVGDALELYRDGST